VFDNEIVRYVDGFFEPSSLVVSARLGYICCVEKAFHVAKLRERLFAPSAFNFIYLVLLTCLNQAPCDVQFHFLNSSLRIGWALQNNQSAVSSLLIYKRLYNKLN